MLTDSFHGTAFSINLNTPFYVFSRSAEKEVNNRMTSRIVALTEKFCLSERYAVEKLTELDFSCCFMSGNAVLEMERKNFHNYLDRCLSQKNQAANLLPDRYCTGCGLCAQTCPRSCIKMEFDAEGFLRPVINLSQCISCKKCVSACPVLHKETIATNEIQQIYAAVYNDSDKLNRSSSGAIFPLMAEWVIQQDGIVFGAAFDDEFNVSHNWSAASDGIKHFYTSKYVQSNIMECYSKAAEFLKNGRLVLFSGTPCQIAAIRSFLGKDYGNLILIECACHGVPSPKVWKSYKTYLSGKYLENEPICHVNFREKIDGQLFFLKVSSREHDYVGSRRSDPYLMGFLNNLILRPSCAACSFKGTHRAADITLADFWGIKRACPEFLPQEGCSMVMLNSEKGRNIWNAVTCEKLHTQAVDKEKVVGKVNAAIWKSVPEHSNRRVFFNFLALMDIETILMHYSTPQKLPFVKRVVRKLKNLLM